MSSLSLRLFFSGQFADSVFTALCLLHLSLGPYLGGCGAAAETQLQGTRGRQPPGYRGTSETRKISI